MSAIVSFERRSVPNLKICIMTICGWTISRTAWYRYVMNSLHSCAGFITETCTRETADRFNLGYFWPSDMLSFWRLGILISVFCRMSKFIDREAGAEDNARWDSDDDFEPPATPDGGWETVENVHVAGGADQVAATVGCHCSCFVFLVI